MNEPSRAALVAIDDLARSLHCLGAAVARRAPLCAERARVVSFDR